MDAITMASVGAVVLTEGIKFLYSQASDVIKRWNERREAAKAEEPETLQSEKAPVAPAIAEDMLEGDLSPLEIHYGQVEKVYPHLVKLRRELVDYQDESLPVDPRDENLIKNVDALRRLLEIVYQQRITFKGEQREQSGPTVFSNIDVDQVLGEIVSIEIGEVGGNAVIRSEFRAKSVEKDAKVTGVKIDKVT
jgi:hypothetical protein